MVNYIDKDGNHAEFIGTTNQEEEFIETLDLISGTFFEVKEQVKVNLQEEVEEIVEKSEEVTDLQKYIILLKNAKVKGAHLIQDVERAKSKCEEL